MPYTVGVDVPGRSPYLDCMDTVDATAETSDPPPETADMTIQTITTNGGSIITVGRERSQAGTAEYTVRLVHPTARAINLRADSRREALACAHLMTDALGGIVEVSEYTVVMAESWVGQFKISLIRSRDDSRMTVWVTDGDAPSDPVFTTENRALAVQEFEAQVTGAINGEAEEAQA